MVDLDALEADLLSLLQGEFSSLTICFNDHASNYCSVAEAIENGLYDHDHWVSEDERRRAVETNRAWHVLWYPDTPVGSYAVLASSLTAAINAAIEPAPANDRSE